MNETKRAEDEALEEQKRKNQGAIDLIRRLMEEEPDEGEEDTWPQLEQMLKEERLAVWGPVPEPEHKEAV